MLITETNLPTPGDRAPPNSASEPPAAPPPAAPADGTAALVAAVRDYVRPSLRDSGFPLAEAFARETRQREAEAADARNRTIATLASIRKDSAQLYGDLNAARAELAGCRTGWSEMWHAVRPLIRPELGEAAKGWTLPALLAEEMRLRAAERDSLVRELSEARDALDAFDQAAQGLRNERDAAVAERVEQEALEALGESLIGEDFVEILEGGIRAELHDRHPDDLSARLAEEFALRDKERADLLEELRVAKADCENAKVTVAAAVGDLAAARRDAVCLRLEKDVLAENLDASRQAHEVDRAYVAQQQGRIEKLERAIVAQATLLSELDDSLRGVLANRFTTRAIRVAER
jgi:hypothetical protein